MQDEDFWIQFYRLLMQDSGIDNIHVNYDAHSFFRAPLVAQMLNSLPAMWETWVGMIPSPGEGKGDPLQYSCLENSMDRRAS